MAEVTATVDAGWDRLVANVLQDLEAVGVEVAARGTYPIVARAQQAWPVKTGFSRELLSQQVQASGDTVTATLENTAPYAGDIVSQGRRPVEDLLERPLEAAVPAIALDLELAVARLVERS